MMRQLLTSTAMLVCAASFAACGTGGGGGSTPGLPPSGPTPTSVTITFQTASSQPLPSAVAYEMNSGAWTAGTLAGNTLTISLPAGVTTYGFAYSCSSSVQAAYVLSTADTLAPTVGCATKTQSFTATISAPVLAGANTSIVCAAGPGGTSLSPGPTEGNVNAGFIPPASDIVESEDQASASFAFSPLLVHIIRGAQLSANQTIALTPITNADAVTTAGTLTETLPNGFSALTFVAYGLSDGSTCPLSVGTAPMPIPQVSAPNVQPGDYFLYGLQSAGANGQGIVSLTTSTSGASIQIPVPAPFVNSAPAPADAPSFAFASYSGFTFSGTEAYELGVRDLTANTDTTLVTSKAAAGTLSTFTIPDLGAIAGFHHPVGSGDTIDWTTSMAMATNVGLLLQPYQLLGLTLGQQFQLAFASGTFTAP